MALWAVLIRKEPVMSDELEESQSAAAAQELPGDLGRRVRHLRERLGWSRAELAERAATSDGYLEYLETRPAAAPSSAMVARLAGALETSVAELLGGGVERAPGQAPAARQPHLVSLDAARCWSLLGAGGVGRIAFASEEGPIALPVNYAVADHDIVLRTAEGTAIASIAPDARVGFEVDHIDDAVSKGWSVLVYATCDHVRDSGDGAAQFDEAPLDPWAGGTREHRIRLRVRSISGRAIESDF
jgi:hypothetical protein